MPKVPTIASHIDATPGTCGGKPRIAGHRIRVQDIVVWTEEGRSVDEIVSEFPQLSLSDIYAALAYYHDHREEIDTDISGDNEFFKRMKSQSKSAMDRLPDRGADVGDSVSS